MMGSLIRKRQKRCAGMEMVELAILLPVLLLMLFALLEMGIVLMRWQTLSNAAREGARTAVVFRSPCNAGTVQGLVQTRVVAYASSASITIAPADVTVTGHCGGAGINTSVTVNHTYNFQVLGAFSTLGPSINLSANSVMRNEG